MSLQRGSIPDDYRVVELFLDLVQILEELFHTISGCEISLHVRHFLSMSQSADTEDPKFTNW